MGPPSYWRPPTIADGALALMTATFEQRVHRASLVGFDGVNLMVLGSSSVDPVALRSLPHPSGLGFLLIVAGELFGRDGPSNAAFHMRDAGCTMRVIDLAAHLGARVSVGHLRGRTSFLQGFRNAWAKDVLRGPSSFMRNMLVQG
jgi:hypothetical protein